MAASSYNDIVQKSYIAFYGRPADPNGLTYWTNKINDAGGNYASIIQAFGASAEATALFGGMSNAEAVNTLYNQIFGRDADTTGLNYYVQKLLNGTSTLVTIAYDIIGGAQNSDLTIVTNKLTAAAAFTAALDTAAEVVGYSGDAAAEVARDWLATVGSTSGSLTSATANLADTVVSVVSVGGQAGTVTTMTTDIENVDGTAGNDTIRAQISGTSTQATFNTGDLVDGGKGNDTLEITWVSSAAPVVDVTNVETVSIRALGDARVDANGWSGVQTIKLAANSTDDSDLSVDNISLGTDISLTGYGSSDFDFKSTQITGSSDSVTLLLSDVGQSAGAMASTFITNGIETIVIDSDGTNYVDLESGVKLKSVTVQGDGDITLTSDDGIGNVNASTLTGDLTLTLSAPSASATVVGGAGDDSIDVSGAAAATDLDGGAGDDTFTFGTRFGSTDAVDGGAGDDTISINQGALSLRLNNVTNVETADIQFVASTGTFNASGASVDAYNLSASGATVALEIQNLASNSDLTFNDDDFENLTIDTAASGSLSLIVGNSGAIDVGTLTITDAVTLNLANAGGSAGAATISGITTNDTHNLTVSLSGQDGLTIDGDVVATDLQSLSITTSGSADFNANGVDFLNNASALTSVTLTAAGSNAADITIAATGAAITTVAEGIDNVAVTLTATDGADIYFEGLSGASGLGFSLDINAGNGSQIYGDAGATGADYVGGTAGVVDQFDVTVATSGQVVIGSVNLGLVTGTEITSINLDVAASGDLTISNVTATTIGDITIDNDGELTFVAAADTAGDLTITNAVGTASVTVASEDLGNVTLNGGAYAATLSLGAGVSAGQTVGDIVLTGGSATNTVSKINFGTVSSITTSGASATFVLSNITATTVGDITLGGDMNTISTIEATTIGTIVANGSATITMLSATTLAALDFDAQDAGAVTDVSLAGITNGTYIYTGAGQNSITSGKGNDEFYLAASTGADTIRFTDSGQGADTVQNFEVGSGGDVIALSVADLDIMSGNNATAAVAAVDVLGVSAGTATWATGTDVIVLRGTAFASTTELLTAIGTNGTQEIVTNSAVTTAGLYVVVWEDTAGDSHVSLVQGASAAAGGATLFGSGAAVTDLVTLTGVDTDNLDVNNIDFY